MLHLLTNFLNKNNGLRGVTPPCCTRCAHEEVRRKIESSTLLARRLEFDKRPHTRKCTLRRRSSRCAQLEAATEFRATRRAQVQLSEVASSEPHLFSLANLVLGSLMGNNEQSWRDASVL